MGEGSETLFRNTKQGVESLVQLLEAKLRPSLENALIAFDLFNRSKAGVNKFLLAGFGMA
jgi:hypothetical protein